MGAVVTIHNLSQQEVKQRTGFSNTFSLICYVMIVCNGDIEVVKKKVSYLTWYEEWFLFLELLHNKTCTTFATASAIFKIKQKDIVPRIFDSKMKMCLDCKKRWPMYATFKEDQEFKEKKWEGKYENQRVVFHDNTGIPINKPLDAFAQRLTYSAYYAGNVGKGGVFVQQCSWLGTFELYPGAILDSDYLNKTGILELQEKLQELDNECGFIPFINIVDRGY